MRISFAVSVEFQESQTSVARQQEDLQRLAFCCPTGPQYEGRGGLRANKKLSKTVQKSERKAKG
jgi:hypothetical protein